MVLGINRAVKGMLSVRGAALLGAVLSPASISTVWLLFREENETFRGLLTLWARAPGELIGFVPDMVASVVFASWLVARQKSGHWLA